MNENKPEINNSLNSKPQNEKDESTNNNTRDYEILPEDYPVYDLTFKIIIIGNSGVGKSCMAFQATKKIFKANSLPTIGFEYMTFILKIKNQVIKLQIWDTCGQETYTSLVANFYRSASMAIIVYAINDKKSYKDISQWINQIYTNSSPDIKIILVGNKVDLESQREITKEEAQKLSKNYNFASFMEVSAKSGYQTRELLFEAAYILYQHYRMNNSDSIEFSFGNNLSIEMLHQEKEITRGCCK